MEIYVVYENPSDYPGKFVVRRWSLIQAIRVLGDPPVGIMRVEMMPDADPVSVSDHLDDARMSIPDWQNRRHKPRHEDDDPVILELWL